MGSPINNAQRIWEIFKLILQMEEGIRNDIEEVKQARALLVLLSSMAGNGSATYNSKELRFVLPHANRNWSVHCYKVIVDWMQKQEDELTMAYGRRERERLGR